ncbi:MAG TPA: hypothetical protein VJ798_03515 [Rhizomicrobium sp.]|nr:hypothetical protein [Rhizomicrobium sp.]
MEFLVFIGLGLVLWAFFAALARAQRRKALMEKYGDADLVERLMRREVWEGQTAEQLLDSRGTPASVDNKVLKTKTTDTWKYNRMGRGQYAIRIIVENGVVVGWKTNTR